MAGEKIRVLISDDNELFRAGLISLLGECESITVVGQAHDGHQAIEKTHILRPDVTLMDIKMPLIDGVSATQQIKAEHPDIHIAMLTVSEEDEALFSAIRSGARSYLAKSISLDELEAAITTIAVGGTVVSPHLAHRLLEEFAHLAKDTTNALKETDQLTAREHEVLELVARGASNKEIATRLVIAENTGYNPFELFPASSAVAILTGAVRMREITGGLESVTSATVPGGASVRPLPCAGTRRGSTCAPKLAMARFRIVKKLRIMLSVSPGKACENALPGLFSSPGLAT